MNNEPMNGLFSEEELAEAAFCMLSVSTANGYVVAAKRQAANSRLRLFIRACPDYVPVLLAHARQLWSALLKKRQRGVEETELAVLLCLLAETGYDVDNFLQGVALQINPVVAWLAALSRRLLQERAGSIQQAQPQSLAESMRGIHLAFEQDAENKTVVAEHSLPSLRFTSSDIYTKEARCRRAS